MLEISLSQFLPSSVSRGIEALAPGAKRRVIDKLVSFCFGSLQVPENHVLKRTIRVAWVQAARDLLGSALKSSRKDQTGEFSGNILNFSNNFRGALDFEADRALDMRSGRNLDSSPIDDYALLLVRALPAHLIGDVSESFYKELNETFILVVKAMTGYRSYEVPSILLIGVESGYATGNGTPRNFAQRVLDQLAHFMQNPRENPEVSTTLLPTLMEMQHRELVNAIEELRQETIDGFDSDSLRDALRTDFELQSKILIQIKDDIRVYGEGIEGIREDFSRFAGAKTISDYRIDSTNSIVIGWYKASPEWWNEMAQKLQAATDRLGQEFSIVPQAWDFASYNIAIPQRRMEARTELWAGFSDHRAKNHAASLVHIGASLSEPVPCDSQFEEMLDAKELLAETPGKKGFFDATSLMVADKLAFIRGGAVPITFETRLILETFLAERPLFVFDDSQNDSTAQEVTSLLQWLRYNGIYVGSRAEFGGGDTWATALLHEIFELVDHGIVNPYRRLDHYLPGDADHFYGRISEQEYAAEWLKKKTSATIADEGQTMLRVSGLSGVGKSSFMNARIAPLAKQTGLTYVTFRPTDLGDGITGQQSPILAFCTYLVPFLGHKSLDDPMIALHDTSMAREAALRWIGPALGSDCRLLIAVDQFEEIVDNLANGWNAQGWKGLLNLICDLSARFGIPVVVTLESSRRDALVEMLPDTPFSRADEIDLLDNDETFLRSVIIEPFADAGFNLAEEVVEQLLHEVHNHQSSGEEASSALPLLALKLHTLFDFVIRSPVLAAKNNQRQFGSGGETLTLDDLNSMSLSISEEINNLAEEAWRESGGGTMNDLNTFLRPFVKVVASANDEGKGRVVLQPVPAQRFHTVMERQTAFQRRRLIVPSPGGFRLVHEAVIRRWPLGNSWYASERDNILRQECFIDQIREWEARGCPEIKEATVEEIALAANLLSARTIDWFYNEGSALSQSEKRNRTYAMKLFEKAENPRTLIKGSPFESRYIHMASAFGMTELVRCMLSTDPDALKFCRTDGRTPLMVAAWMHLETVEYLLEAGADPDQPDENGFTALDSAIWGENEAMFNLLLPRTDPSKSPEEKNNPLYSATRRGRRDFLHKLEATGTTHPPRTGTRLL